MKVIIVENELYLAQSIAAKLGEFNFETEIYSSVKEAMGGWADVYLLSTSLPGQNVIPLIKKAKDKNIILMVNYINNDTVGEPLKAGARDYILKPFMIEELIRKIEHYHEYRLLQERNRFFVEYTEELFREIELDIDIMNLSLPVVVRTNYQRIADKLALRLNMIEKNTLQMISLAHSGWKKRMARLDDSHIWFITHLEKLKKSELEYLFSAIEDKRFLMTDCSGTVETPFETITLNCDSKLYDQNDILTIDEYVQYIVKTFQYKFPDTELSKKLGISRKSLWEKRKKYELFKKK